MWFYFLLILIDMEFTLNIASHSSYKEAPILPGGRNVLLHAQDYWIIYHQSKLLAAVYDFCDLLMAMNITMILQRLARYWYFENLHGRDWRILHWLKMEGIDFKRCSSFFFGRFLTKWILSQQRLTDCEFCIILYQVSDYNLCLFIYWLAVMLCITLIS